MRIELPPVEVRRIGAHEGTVLRQVRLAALLDAPSAFGSTHAREVGFTADEWTSRAELAASGDSRATFLAWAGREVVGLVGGFRPAANGAIDADAVDLVSMWTAPDARRRGAGRQLVQAVIDWSAASGATRVELWVVHGNDPARRLYETMGFRETGDHQPLPSDPCKDEVRMVLRLDRA